MSRIRLERLVCEPGQHTHTQAELADRIRTKLSAIPSAGPIRKVAGLIFDRAEIRHRHLELDEGERDRRQDWCRAVGDATFRLGLRALRSALPDPEAAARCDALITVSSSHGGFPSLSRRLQESAGLPLEVACFDLTGGGCAGPSQGLHLADLLLHSGQARRVCLLCVDVMGSHGELRRFQEAPSMEELVAHCLASDGAAAAVLSIEAGPGLSYAALDAQQRLWPETLDQNFYCASERNEPYMAVGKNIRTRLLDETGAWFAGRRDDEMVLMHPGGAALMARLAEAIPSMKPSIELSTSILRDHGNLGSASVLFVLHRALERELEFTPVLTLFALGPGIVTTASTLHGVRRIAA